MRTKTLLLTAALLATGAAAPAAHAAPPAPLRILLTNDDGYTAPGIAAVFDALTAAGHDVTMIAPLENQSGVGTKTNQSPTLTAKHVSAKVWAVSGTPSDSVNFGLSYVFKDKAPDLVVSGTNFGQNVASIATTSGTMAAAVTALNRSVPAVALSTEQLLTGQAQPTLNAQKHTAAFTVRLLDRLRSAARGGPLLPTHVGLNVNYPVVGSDGTAPARSWRLTSLDRVSVLTPTFTPSTGDTFQAGVSFNVTPSAPDSDLAALSADTISITPLDGDWTAGPLDRLRTLPLLTGLRP